MCNRWGNDKQLSWSDLHCITGPLKISLNGDHDLLCNQQWGEYIRQGKLFIKSVLKKSPNTNKYFKKISEKYINISVFIHTYYTDFHSSNQISADDFHLTAFRCGINQTPMKNKWLLAFFSQSTTWISFKASSFRLRYSIPAEPRCCSGNSMLLMANHMWSVH